MNESINPAVDRAMQILRESGQESERQVHLMLEAEAALALVACSATAEKIGEDHKEGIFSVVADKLLLVLRTQDLSDGNVNVSLSYSELASLAGFLLEDEADYQWLIPKALAETSRAVESFVKSGGVDSECLLLRVNELSTRKGLGL